VPETAATLHQRGEFAGPPHLFNRVQALEFERLDGRAISCS